ncbi:MAG TPA: ribonuclease Y [Candidatus Omnitrophica bacterium]|nr:MAG: ribonuclease Y [Omnitrophica WOR_2 bacterium GWA2_63_20]OGX18231.1 MAG: ribonuclease Y [Omnitrophica WOR_2 bacterium GWF2_63_9]OGX30711.1 MAG: ribonuclease Y [Omnitrophica WOR_2 bacterium RIFCSPHIGHO2_12_FULL_64_13]OGX44975.1 MAG: ribonuclease Y [Omnitrophica WOR_2 bacterium RIFCSPLOWO2_02_FULL_63_16]OGX49631.1 MAG: ribonuclease Y [Omnitrophica WOR_2 bacterium RIFCSPLOWO2_12_FULL_63_16]HAM39950.1 ribonuclease Y [Candidatus Omnitrophota bacterium]
MTILAVLVILGVGGLLFLAGYGLRLLVGRRQLGSAERHAKEVLEQAARDAKTVLHKGELDAKEFLNTLRKDFEGETRDRRNEIAQLEKRLHQREEVLDRKLDVLDRKDKELTDRARQLGTREQALKTKEDQLSQLIAEENEKLKSVASLTSEQAKQLLLSRIDQECRSEAGLVIKRIEEETRKDAQAIARKVLVETMQRCAAEFSVESTTAAVPLPNEEMKGRIIGREGRNIKAFELATGVDLIVDDTPDVVTLSSFDLMRREIARAALERLMADGRIHPARIEEIVEKVKREFDQSVQQEGEKALAELNLHGMHAELVKLLGRLRYRTSYGQNCLLHLKESAFICGMIAAELGLDQRMAKRCALMHDIGKAVSHEVEGPHALIGAELAKRYGEPPEVVHSIEAHHEDVVPSTVYAVLTIVADSISGSRPGARGDTLEAYVKRLQTLEHLCDSFKGVAKAYAIQAGREVRVMVQPERVTDLEAIALAREIKKKVESAIEFPGQIKITVIRETRTIEYAR